MPIDRQLLLGIGVGLLLAATVSAFGGAGHRTLSRPEVIQRAKALGMVFPDEAKLNLNPTPPPAPPQPVANTSAADPEVKLIECVVPPGATGAEVARLLRAKGLISEEEEFLKLAAGAGEDTRFQPGTYRLRGDITVKALIARLRRGPKAE